MKQNEDASLSLSLSLVFSLSVSLSINLNTFINREKYSSPTSTISLYSRAVLKLLIQNCPNCHYYNWYVLSPCMTNTPKSNKSKFTKTLLQIRAVLRASTCLLLTSVKRFTSGMEHLAVLVIKMLLSSSALIFYFIS